MPKRIIAAYCLLALAFGLLFTRTARLSTGEGLAKAAVTQSTRTFVAETGRACIYDRYFTPLVNARESVSAAVLPELLDGALAARLAALGKDYAPQLAAGSPFVVREAPDWLAGDGVYRFASRERYSDGQTAAHIVGHLSGGEGVSGAELAFDEFLSTEGTRVSITYKADGAGSALLSTEPELSVTGKEAAGVVLTIDARLQERVERALARRLASGAAVVMDVKSGELLAVASLPEYDPAKPAASLSDSGLPFLNRAFAAWPVGSTFKLAVAAAALEAGHSTARRYDCTGSIMAGGQRFNCHWLYGHNEIDMEAAVKFSCNTYFIDLALELGPQRIRETAANLGFGVRDIFAAGWETADGHLQSAQELTSPADTANFAFGQGSLTATPVQIAKLVSAIANGGLAVTPKLWLGTLDGEGVFTQTPECAQNRVFSERTAALLRAMMAQVVREGSGTGAMPVSGGAGGKTASAQTGRFREDGTEVVEAWFAGFWPELEPRYAIVVLAEGMESGSEWAAPVFRDIANALYALGIKRSG